MPDIPDYLEVSHNDEAESALLACVLINPDAWRAQPVPRVRAEHFHDEQCRTAWAAALDLRERGVVVDLLTLIDELARTAKLEQAGGESRLAAYAWHVPTSRNAGEYAGIVLRNANRRLGMQAYGDFAQAALHGTDEQYYEQWVYTRDLLNDGFNVSGMGQRYQLLPDLDVEDLAPPDSLLGPVLYTNSVGVLYAQPGRWKTFLTASWALSLATGMTWLGRFHVAQPVDVVYVAAEGGHGLGKRITAWKCAYGFYGRQTRLRVLPVPVELLEAARVQELVGSIYQHDLQPALVVFDTLAASLRGGSDRDDEDVGTAIRAAYRIKEEFGSCVLLIHHPPKGGVGPRGASNLVGDVDFVYSINPGNDHEGHPMAYTDKIDPGKVVSLVCEKAHRDEAGFLDIPFTCAPIEWTVAETGERRQSLVVVPPGQAERFQAQPKRAYNPL